MVLLSQLVPTEQGYQTILNFFLWGAVSQLVPTEQGCQTSVFLVAVGVVSQLVPTEQGCQTYRLQLVDLHTKPRVTAL